MAVSYDMPGKNSDKSISVYCENNKGFSANKQIAIINDDPN